jgi:hypothetical protein
VVFPGLFAVLLLLIVFAIIPVTMRFMQTHKLAIISIVVAVIAILFGHAYVFGLPGRIGEWRLERAIRPGMTPVQVTHLAARFGGADVDGQSLTQAGDVYDATRDGAIYVYLTDFITLCIVGGNRYEFDFGPDLKLASWKRISWGNAC